MVDAHPPKLEIPGYEVLQRIGGGGMGDVYRANQISPNRPVAIKVLKPVPDLRNAELERRFQREASLTDGLAHPNVVAVFDHGSIDGHYFLVMEYVDGENLRQRLCPGEPMPVEQARPILRAVSQGLSYLHERRILHRDLKPENVLLDKTGDVKISDFGIAVSIEQVGSVTQSGQFVGTVDYLAPEQRHRLEIDERADQFSLAVLTYEMLTGHKPLGIFKRPSEQNPRLARRVDEAILRGLQRDPEDRYATVDEFSSALDGALAGVADSRQRWWRATTVATIAIAALAGVLIWLGALRIPQDHVSLSQQPLDTVRQGEQQKQRWLMTEAVVVSPATLFTADEAGPYQRQWADYLKLPVTASNTIGMSFVLIPPGEFQMGSSEAEIARLCKLRALQRWDKSWERLIPRESPQHIVKITKAYYLARAEVTVGEFRTFVEATGYETDAEKGGETSGWIRGDWVQKPGFSWSNLGEFEAGDNYPVVNVSHNDATAFCGWLSETEKLKYRLPTEAEWEYACRAGSTSRWCFGDEEPLLDRVAWHLSNSGYQMRVVGQKSPNGFGLFDMHGNVWEWCSDWYGSDYYATSPTKDPTGPPVGSRRVIRGGGFRALAAQTRSPVRIGDLPSYRRCNFGFRVAREVGRGSPVPMPRLAEEQPFTLPTLPR